MILLYAFSLPAVHSHSVPVFVAADSEVLQRSFVPQFKINDKMMMRNIDGQLTRKMHSMSEVHSVSKGHMTKVLSNVSFT